MSSVLIFVVEDDALILDDLRTALEDGGFTVSEALNAEDAMAMLDKDSTAYNALVTDINLAPGGLTGWDIAKHARELVPEIPVIYTTAASSDEWSARGVPNSVLIHKPYAVAQVLTAIAQLLNVSGAAPKA